MISKKEWYKPRLLGFGLTPVTWEGWVYILVAVLLFVAALNLPASDLTRIIIAGIILAIFFIDALHITLQLYKDRSQEEKQEQYRMEAIASSIAIIGLLIGIIYRIVSENIIDPILVIILAALLLGKFIPKVIKSK